MASAKRAYPRATLRKILKAHAEKKISRDVDVLVYLDYVLFVQELIHNATRKAKESGEKTLQAKDIRKVTVRTLRQFKG